MTGTMEKSPQKILAVVGIGTVLSLVYSALNYATQIALVELFGYHLRGVFEILMSVIGLASVLFSFNLYTALNLHISRNQGVPDNLGKIGAIALVVQILGLLVLFLLSPKEEIGASEHAIAFVVLLVSAGVLNHKVNEFTAILNGNQHFIDAKKLTLVGALLSALAILLVFALGVRDPTIIVWVAVLGPFLGSYLYSRFLLRKRAELLRVAGTLRWSSLYRENGAVYVISLAQFISIKLYLLYVARTESVEMLGVFSLSYSLIQFVMLPATFLATMVISSQSDSLGALSRPFKVLLGYSVLSCAGLVLGIELGLLELLPLRSLQNPLFVGVLEVMALSIPFSVLNILVVATAIRKNMCSRSFVGGQLLMVPLFIVFYHLGADLLLLESAVGVSYVATWLVSSVLTLLALQIQLRKSKSKGMAWPVYP